jgi:SagB-type dehydrogenase family enzyme
VFDWHYLFGYGTVLLIAVHLAFNFRIVWSHWRSRGAPPASPPNTALGRRGALGTLGWTMATGAAFAIGCGTAAPTCIFGPGGAADARTATGASAAGALARVEAFHAFSSHSRTHVLQRAPSSDWADAPPAFKRYIGDPQISLPAPASNAASSFDLGALGSALWHTSGVTESRGGLALRAAPSSGALFSTELYVVARDVRGLSNGLWHYEPGAHRLIRIGDAVSDAVAALEPSDLASKPQAFVVATAVFGRTAHKYRDRTYRYVLADLGHALENLRVATSAVGASAECVAGFDESRIAAALGIDEAAEGVLAVLALGPAAMPASTRDAVAPTAASTHWRIPDRMPAAASLLPVTAAIHTATSLRRSAAPTADSQASTRSAALPAGAIALPRAKRELANVLGVIAGRRSRRRFASTPLPLVAVGSVLDQAMRVGPLLSEGGSHERRGPCGRGRRARFLPLRPRPARAAATAFDARAARSRPRGGARPGRGRRRRGRLRAVDRSRRVRRRSARPGARLSACVPRGRSRRRADLSARGTAPAGGLRGRRLL